MRGHEREYPSETAIVEVGEIRLEVEVVAHLERYIDATALLRDEDAPEPPYWLHLWTGSRALAEAISAHPGWAGRRVADVGCGLGVAGLVAAKLGARVVFVDAALDAVYLARENARANHLAVAAVQTDMCRPGIRGPFDAVLMADVTYDTRLQEALAAFLSTDLALGGFALCAESVRVQDDGFGRACVARGLTVSEREVRVREGGRPVPVRFTEVRR